MNAYPRLTRFGIRRGFFTMQRAAGIRFNVAPLAAALAMFAAPAAFAQWRNVPPEANVPRTKAPAAMTCFKIPIRPIRRRQRGCPIFCVRGIP